MESKKTLLLGASENPSRYSNMAILRLRQKGHEVIAVGKKAGKVDDVEIVADQPEVSGIDTITLYLNPENQKPYYDYIIKTKPKRIIFNPGTENEELEQLAEKEGINVLEACTLVMLGTGQF